MQNNQLTRGIRNRLMYIENKDGEIDGHVARIGLVTFSKSADDNGRASLAALESAQ